MVDLQTEIAKAIFPIFAKRLWDKELSLDEAIATMTDSQATQLIHAADSAAGVAISIIQKRLTERFTGQLLEQLR